MATRITHGKTKKLLKQYLDNLTRKEEHGKEHDGKECREGTDY